MLRRRSIQQFLRYLGMSLVLYLCLLYSGEASAAPVDETRSVNQQVAVTAKIKSGDLKVTGWSQNKIQVSGDLGSDWSIDVSKDGRKVTVDLGKSCRGTVQIRLPSRGSLIADSLKGAITVNQISGAVEVATISGDVSVSGSPSEVDVKTVSGALSLRNKSSRTSAKSVSGHIEMTGATGKVTATNVSGAIRFAESKADRVTAQSTSGELVYNGKLGKGPHSFTAHAGSVVMSLSPTQRGSFTITTFGGRFDNKLGGKTRRRGNTYEVEVGTGGPEVTVSTFSGDVLLEKTDK